MAADWRPELRAAVESWLAEGEHPVLREAFDSFLAGRYAGRADDLKKVHAARRRFFGDKRPVGSLYGVNGLGADRTLDHAAYSSAPVDQGRLLFQLSRTVRPHRALELGTNIGISAAYIALGLEAAGSGRLTTIEASPACLRLAEELFADLGLYRVDTVGGYFDPVLPDLLPSISPVQLAFLDGNHRHDATLRYFDLLRPHMPAGSLMVLDDIRWSEGMFQAWSTIRSSTEVAALADLGRTGIVVLT